MQGNSTLCSPSTWALLHSCFVLSLSVSWWGIVTGSISVSRPILVSTIYHYSFRRTQQLQVYDSLDSCSMLNPPHDLMCHEEPVRWCWWHLCSLLPVSQSLMVSSQSSGILLWSLGPMMPTYLFHCPPWNLTLLTYFHDCSPIPFLSPLGNQNQQLIWTNFSPVVQSLQLFSFWSLVEPYLDHAIRPHCIALPWAVFVLLWST